MIRFYLKFLCPADPSQPPPLRCRRSDTLDYDYNGACAVPARSLVQAPTQDTAERRWARSRRKGGLWPSRLLVLRGVIERAPMRWKSSLNRCSTIKSCGVADTRTQVHEPCMSKRCQHFRDVLKSHAQDSLSTDDTPGRSRACWYTSGYCSDTEARRAACRTYNQD
jgi:hypothetical protein